MSLLTASCVSPLKWEPRRTGLCRSALFCQPLDGAELKFPGRADGHRGGRALQGADVAHRTRAIGKVSLRKCCHEPHSGELGYDPLRSLAF